ncbi:MAG: NifU N-terminal domain-containing protein [Actinomycetota bacterium]|nr:NifU N-terminal domain-containing protein [Actinomycetota bacterium]
MAVQISNTPNPNALKFTVGVDVGGPATFVAGSEIDDPAFASLVAIDGVTSVFMTADFVTLSKTPDTSWDVIAPQATGILEERFGDR